MRWFARHGLRVLMYHKVSSAKGDALTVTREQLKAQMRWLKEEEFPFVTAAQVMAEARGEPILPADSVLVTFDDAYRDTFDLAFPILRQLEIPAVVFVPTAFIGQTSSWDADPQPLMNLPQLRELTDAGWELGLHSHRHLNYQTLRAAEIAADLQACQQTFGELSLRSCAALAYAYGRRPRAPEARQRMHSDLRAINVRIAFRIGNRINRLPLSDGFEINRLGVRGDRGLAAFQRQIWWGRWF